MDANIADFIKETSNTAGTGLNIALASATGYARFSDVYSVNDLVYYVIRDGNNAEAGKGTIKASNTIDRTTPLVTLAGGIYDNTSPSRINLSGSAEVAIAPTALAVLDAANDTSAITYETLNTNGDVGTSAGQLAIGDHVHTGVYEPADATILKDADIGSTVQAYDATYVVDADIGVNVQAYSSILAATTASFLTADEAKLDGVEVSATADQTGAEIKTAYEAEANTNAYTDAEKTKLTGVEALADVTDTINVTAAGALMDSEVDADIKTLSLPASTTISAFGATIIDDANASAVHTTLGLVIGTDVQAYDATYVVDADIGSTVQAYDADTAKLDVVQSYTAGQSGGEVTLTSATTVTPDFDDGNFFSLEIDHTATLANPSNIVVGKSGSIFIPQGSTGGTLAYGSYWDFAGGITPALSTGTGVVDRLDYTVRTTTSIHAVLTRAWS